MGIEAYWKDVVERAEVNVFFRGNTRLIPRCDAVRFAKWAAKDKRILGFEGFLFDGESVMPLMECIADLSNLPKSDNGLEHALEILAKPDFQKPAFIEFVLD